MDKWSLFLENIADQYSLPPSPKKLFLYHFNRERRNWTVTEIEKEFISINNVTSINFDDYRRRLYALFEKDCPELIDASRNKSYILWVWLEEKYKEWVTENSPPDINELWEELLKSAVDGRDIFGPIVINNVLPTLGLGTAIEETFNISEFRHKIRVGDSIQLKISPIINGKILLLEKNKIGKVYCLCPSFIKPENTLIDSPLIFPDRPISLNEPDHLSLLLVIFQELPSFNWLPMIKGQSLEIGYQELQQVQNHPQISRSYSRYYIIQ
jgi:hypothetical protein